MKRIDFEQVEDEASNVVYNLRREGVKTSRRSSRLFNPVYLPFIVIVGSTSSFCGRAFTLDEIEIDADPTDLSDTQSVVLTVGSVVEILLRVQLYGFTVEIEAKVEVIDVKDRAADGVIQLAFRDMSGRSRDALRDLMRSYHSGHVPTASDLIDAHDPETEMAAATDSPASVASGRWLRNIAGIVVSSGVILGAFAFIGVLAIERFLLIQAEIATVTAPAVEMISPEMGQVRTPIEALGQMVGRDDRLYTVHSATLVAEAQALEARIELLTQTLKDAGTASQEGISLWTDGRENRVSGNTGQATSEEIRRELSLAEGELSALQVRLASLIGFAPCECLVSWYQEDGGWVVPGDTVAILARTDEEALRVEALVHVANMEELFVGQRAIVTNIATGETTEGAIERITLDPRQQERIGFPQWLRQEPTLASVIIDMAEPLNPSLIGQPIEVAIQRQNGPFWSRLPTIRTNKDMAQAEISME